MRPYADFIAPARVRGALQVIVSLRESTPSKDDKSNWISCHALAHAIAARDPRFEAHDGYFLRPGWEHSWLTLKDTTGWVFDAYPIASIGLSPLVVDVRFPSPWFNAYMEHYIQSVYTDAVRAQIEYLKGLW